ncbi:unnamed protein product [Clavelina lepadiformis]|uniref:Uncharacterized protein n=1 Tax=Clavelina lepadiformis TaxID=159417 RepID=A0ABP0G010_CLALP
MVNQITLRVFMKCDQSVTFDQGYNRDGCSEEVDWVRKCLDVKRNRGKLRKRWLYVVERDIIDCGLSRDDANDEAKWRKLSRGTTGQHRMYWDHSR